MHACSIVYIEIKRHTNFNREDGWMRCGPASNHKTDKVRVKTKRKRFCTVLYPTQMDDIKVLIVPDYPSSPDEMKKYE